MTDTPDDKTIEPSLQIHGEDGCCGIVRPLCDEIPEPRDDEHAAALRRVGLGDW